MADPLFGMGAPPELAAQAQQLARRRALMEALMSRSIGPQQMPQSGGRIASQMSPLQPMAQVLQAYMSAKGLKTADSEQQALGMQYKEGRNKAITEYMMGRQGSPLTGALKAATSDYGDVAELGKADLLQQMKSGVDTKDVLGLGAYSATSKVAAAEALRKGDPNWHTYLKPEDKTTSVGNTLVSTTEGQPPKSLGYYGDEYEKNPDGTPKITQVIGAEGKPEPYQRNIKTGKLEKLDNAARVTATANASNPQNKGLEALFKNAADTVQELGKTARSSAQLADGLKRMQELDSAGVFSNVTAGPATFLTNLAQAAGVPIKDADAAKLGRTETYNSIATEAWQRLVSQMGGNRNVTREEAMEIKTILPQTRNSPQARERLYQIWTQVSQREVQRFHKANKALTDALAKNDPAVWQSQFADIFAPLTEVEDVPPMTRPQIRTIPQDGSQPPTPLRPQPSQGDQTPRPFGNLRPY